MVYCHNKILLFATDVDGDDYEEYFAYCELPPNHEGKHRDTIDAQRGGFSEAGYIKFVKAIVEWED